MQLTRLAIIGLSNPAPAKVLRTAYLARNGVKVVVNDVNGAELTAEREPLAGFQFMWPRDEAEAHVAVSATVSELKEEFSEAGHLVIPTGARLRAEAAIEEFGDILAVAYQCRRVVRSPEPCVALRADHPGELRSADTLEKPSSLGKTPPRLLDPLVDPEVAGLMQDRHVGAALLAGALSSESPIERARDFYRLYESAFASGMGGMTKKLFAFLSSSPYDMEFSTTEIHKWVSLRGAVMHADKRVAFGVDIEPYLVRMEWAAYDLILHKQKWGTTDALRRPGLAFKSGVVPSKGLVVWGEAVVRTQWLDAFGAYEIDRTMTPKLGDDFVFKFHDE